ncbi:MAG: hypothetical protein ACFCVC_03960 [Acidimicrobiia bacterium]
MIRTTFAAGVAALSLAACSGAAGTETTGPIDLSPETFASVTTVAPVTPEGDVEDVLADLQTRFADFGARIEASGAEAELNEAWNEAQAVILEALTTIQSGEMMDMSTIESTLDDFEQAVPTTETEVMTAWQELRSTLEEAIQTANAG